MLLRRHNERSQPSQRTDSAHCFPASSRTVEAIEWRVASWQLGVCSCHLISASWGSCVPGLQEWIEFADWLQVILVALVLKVRINMQHFRKAIAGERNAPLAGSSSCHGSFSEPCGPGLLTGTVSPDVSRLHHRAIEDLCCASEPLPGVISRNWNIAMPQGQGVVSQARQRLSGQTIFTYTCNLQIVSCCR